jgi:DNA-binding transcriptional ArsR family regulator
MRQPPHPGRGQLSLVAVLHGLSDPARLEIVRLLAAAPERPCTDFHGLGGLTGPTLSHHLRVLREAGLTRTRIDGRRRYLSLRREDLEGRFPGVIDPIISCAGTEHHPDAGGGVMGL